MLNTNNHQLTRFGVAANITLVAAFSLLTVVLISHRGDTMSNHEVAPSLSIVQPVSLEQALSGVEVEQTFSLDRALASVKDTGG